MRYLKYDIKNPIIAGITHKRACLSYLFADSILENRIPIIPKTTLDFSTEIKPFVQSYIVDEYYKISLDYILEEDVRIENDVLIKSFEHDSFWEFDIDEKLKKLTAKIHGIGMNTVIPMWEPVEHTKVLGNKILNSLKKPIIGIHLRKAASNETWWNHRVGIKKYLAEMEIDSLLKKIKNFDYGSVFIGTYQEIENRPKNIFTIGDFNFEFENNFFKYLVEQYVIDHSNISIRTFSDSSIHFKKDFVGNNYSIFKDRWNTHMTDIPNWPNGGGKLYKQNYKEKL